jgi:hypothetical protein
MPDLNGVRLKIDRANYHFKQLGAALQAWGTAGGEDRPLVINSKVEGKHLNISQSAVRPDDPKWGLIVGDIVHNLRSALDHLVCQLALLNGKPLSCCAGTYFPTCLNPTDFARAKSILESLLFTKAFAMIEGLQPYNATNAGKDPKSSTLWILSKLDIIDKHRMLLVTAKYFRVTELAYKVDNLAPVTIPVEDRWEPLKDGAQIASVDLSGHDFNLPHEVRVQGGTEVQIFFQETGLLCDGYDAQAILGVFGSHVTEIIDDFDAAFFH